MPTPKTTQRGLPAERIHQRHRERRIEKLAERARRRAGAEGERTPARRQELAESAEHDRERAAGKAEADEHAGPEIEHPGRGRIRHQDETDGIEHAAGAQHAHGAVAIGNRAGERLTHTPQDVLYGQRQPEHVAIPTVVLGHRREKETERRARTEAQQRNHAAARHDHGGRAPADAGDAREGKATKWPWQNLCEPDPARQLKSGIAIRRSYEGQRERLSRAALDCRANSFLGVLVGPRRITPK